jgi:drug/metabolite transporter (DMT)-like permease
MTMHRWAVLGLLVNATVWGLSWIGFKSLNAQGLHPLWMTAVISGLACVVTLIAKPSACMQVMRSPALRLVLVAAGLTNICFNTAVTLGDVLRVTLLFYLMPVWAAMLAHYFLGERVNRLQALRLSVGLLGAMLVLWQPSMGFPLPSNLADWLGIAGGFFFALNNVSLRKAQAASDNARALAMFMGGFVCSTGLAIVLASQSVMPWPSVLSSVGASNAALELLLWSVLFLVANYGVQYGAARLPANLTALIMLSEIFIAGVSSAMLGASTIRWQELLGGLLILISPFLFPAQEAKNDV